MRKAAYVWIDAGPTKDTSISQADHPERFEEALVPLAVVLSYLGDDKDMVEFFFVGVDV